MVERRNLGDILIGFGRITEDDAEKALAYQRESGGYFGEALLALGMVTKEELEWSLASQFDLPYVFPDIDSIDPRAAAIVTAEWALANLTLPIMKSNEALTVVVNSPNKTEVFEELKRRSGLEIRPALAPVAKIRELIRQVYTHLAVTDDEPDSFEPVELTSLFAAAIEHGATRFGISLRGPRVTGWYEDRTRVWRRLLTANWSEALEQLLVPPPSAQVDGQSQADWTGRVAQGGSSQMVDVRYIESRGGAEYVFRTLEERSRVHEQFSPPPPQLLAEVRLLITSGPARFAVKGTPPDVALEVLPYLPNVLLGPFRRAVHLTQKAHELEEVFALTVPTDPQERRKFLTGLRMFRFDVVTADLDGPVGEWLGDVLELAAVTFVPRGRETEEIWGAGEGIRWELQVTRGENGTLRWSLDSLAALRANPSD